MYTPLAGSVFHDNHNYQPLPEATNLGAGCVVDLGTTFMYFLFNLNFNFMIILTFKR